MSKSLTQFIICIGVLLLLATPLFYWLTKNFYAEDMIDLIEAVRQNKPIPTLDLEEDILQGIMLQFALIISILGAAMVIMMRLISKRLWRPFEETLKKIEGFRLEKGTCPVLTDCDVKEFSRLNSSLDNLMRGSLKSYKLQKEFTENASHELQTPLAVFQSKLDLLLQLPDITEKQAEIIEELYQTVGRMSRLNRNLLLLAKMENRQFSLTDTVDVVEVVNDIIPYLETLTNGLTLTEHIDVASMPTAANRTLMESMVSNLVVNAVRHNKPDGEIRICVKEGSLSVENTSDEPALNADLIFNRFYRPSEKVAGNGLGLAIVKAVCDYHGWTVAYEYRDNLHVFTVKIS